MVSRQLLPNGIADPRVLAAMAAVPREEFVPPGLRGAAYDDRALPIGHGQTISQPFVVAAMTQALALRPGDHALEVGAGSGYQAAVLGRLCANVVTIELEPELAAAAERTLARVGAANVTVVNGDGVLGWPEAAPYQGVLVAAVSPRIPPALLEQLDEGGRLVAPIGEENGDQELRLMVKGEGAIRSRILFPVRFVPLRRSEPLV